MFFNLIWCQPNFMIITSHIHTQAWSKNIKFTNSYSSSDEVTTNKIIKGWGKRNKRADRIPCGQIPVWVQHSKQNLLRPSLHYRQTESVIQFTVTCQHGLFLSKIANRATDRQAPSCYTSYRLHVDLLQRFYHEEHVLTPHVCLLAFFYWMVAR